MPPLKLPLFSVAAALGIVVAACTAPSMPEAPDGAKFYVENCVACHGMSAKGDGPLASTLDTMPTDLTSCPQEWGQLPTRAGSELCLWPPRATRIGARYAAIRRGYGT
ncbi:c-type cytochrome [Sulfitobacter faviae]|uniref:c-type cytochrome n=1 Tax=Sulfitobacter faviae TaxID=1775881 RepID=UPI00398CD7EF